MAGKLDALRSAFFLWDMSGSVIKIIIMKRLSR